MGIIGFSVLKHFISQNLKELPQFLRSISFFKALRVGIAVTLPVLIGSKLGYYEIGLALSFGAFWSSPSDITGSLKHTDTGILMSAGLVMLISFIKAYLQLDLRYMIPTLGLITFSIAYISVYGFRASLVSFSGLMALALSFARDTNTLEIYQYAILTGVGGLWYLFLSKVWHYINPKAETEEFLMETYILTADFLALRGKLLDPKENYSEIQSQLVILQQEITGNHETLREILILSRTTSGLSNYQNKRLLIFIQLIDMLEAAIANPVNYARMAALFSAHPRFIKSFQDVIYEMSNQLRMISRAANGDPEKLPKNEAMKQFLKTLSEDIDSLRDKHNYEEYLMFQNLFEYQYKQFEKIKRIKLLLGDIETSKMDIIDRKNAKRFIVAQDYDLMVLLRNLSLKSTIFRHSCRLAITVMIGFGLGSIFEFQNPYSILLVTIVIMRPSYGLTRNRAKDRLIGTLIGAIIASGVVFFIQNPYAYGILGVISLVIAIALLQKNYKASATFITLSVVFIYAILSADILNLIKFRLVDTLVGVILSYVAMRWILPVWEFSEINESIEKSVVANKNFLHKISEYYQHKGTVPTSYNIARKHAFLETSNLGSAFQRMTQEPKSKRREMDKVYELVVLNHTFLASLASLSTFIKQNKTTQFTENFVNAIDKIDRNLDNVLLHLKSSHRVDELEVLEADSLFKPPLISLNDLETQSFVAMDKESIRTLQEVHLVWEQLNWLFDISTKMNMMSRKSRASDHPTI